jgi:hypothetical protein
MLISISKMWITLDNLWITEAPYFLNLCYGGYENECASGN